MHFDGVTQPRKQLATFSTISRHVLSFRTVQHWLNWFNNGNLEIEDSPRSGRALEVDLGVLKQLIEEDPRLVTRCLSEQLGCIHTTVEAHLRVLGKTWKYSVWISDELSPYQLQLRVDASLELMTSHRNYRWCHNLITGDEKWMLYVNHTHKR